MKRKNKFFELDMDHPRNLADQLRKMIPGDRCNLSLQSSSGRYKPDVYDGAVFEGLLPTDFTCFDSEYEYSPDGIDSRSNQLGYSFLVPRVQEFCLGITSKRTCISDTSRAIVSYRIPQSFKVKRDEWCYPTRAMPFFIPAFFKGYVKRLFFVNRNWYDVPYENPNLRIYPQELLERKKNLLGIKR